MSPRGAGVHEDGVHETGDRRCVAAAERTASPFERGVPPQGGADGRAINPAGTRQHRQDGPAGARKRERSDEVVPPRSLRMTAQPDGAAEVGGLNAVTSVLALEAKPLPGGLAGDPEEFGNVCPCATTLANLEDGLRFGLVNAGTEACDAVEALRGGEVSPVDPAGQCGRGQRSGRHG